MLQAAVEDLWDARGAGRSPPPRCTRPSRWARCSTSRSSSTRAWRSRPRSARRSCWTPARRSRRALGRGERSCATGRGRSTSTCCCSGTVEYESERLAIPHRELARRRFVLVPLLELEPELALPDGTPLAVALEALGDGAGGAAGRAAAGRARVSFTLEAAGPFSLASSARFWAGYPPADRPDAADGPGLRLAFLLDSLDGVAGVALRERDGLIVAEGSEAAGCAARPGGADPLARPRRLGVRGGRPARPGGGRLMRGVPGAAAGALPDAVRGGGVGRSERAGPGRAGARRPAAAERGARRGGRGRGGDARHVPGVPSGCSR